MPKKTGIYRLAALGLYIDLAISLHEHSLNLHEKLRFRMISR